MPTPWKRSPEELHKTYIANTEAFYKVAGRGLAQELDEFVVSCALGLWKGSPRLGQQHVDAVNQLYSKGRKPARTFSGSSPRRCAKAPISCRRSSSGI